MRVLGLKFDELANGWRGCDYKRGEESDLTAYKVGRIPFERIASIDWSGDEYYGVPHIYCRFSSPRKEPYEEIVVCRQQEINGTTYYSEIGKLDEIRRLTRKRGVEFYD